MGMTFMILSGVLILLSVLPFVQHQHWVFRVPEFLKLQILVLQVVVFVLWMVLGEWSPVFWILQGGQFALMVYHVYILMRYTKFWRTKKIDSSGQVSDKVKVISCNVYQFNTEHERFVQLVKDEQPDIVITMESNKDWERAMRVLEDDYPNHQKITLENTYGMHFYTKLNVIRLQTHYFVADDVPSVEAELETTDGYRFLFFGVHPPPPSPTEEENSKERDGELLSVAKRVRNQKLPVVVTGDFNNVAWAKASILFKKTSELIDARIGRGILATFHANYWFFRVPLDLFFHSPEVFIDRLLIYPSVGSDHFPMGCTFHLGKPAAQQEDVEHLEADEKKEVDELIVEGKTEESDNRD